MFIPVAKSIPALAAACLFMQALPATAQGYGSPYPNNNSNCATPNYQRGSVSYVPAGLTFPVMMSTAISTDVARPGDTVQAQLSQPINLGNGMIPPGSTVLGNIADAKAGGFLGRSGMLTVKFNRLRLPNGMEVPMSAHIVGGIGKYAQQGNGSDTFRGEGVGTKVGQVAMRGALGAGTGAALGTAIGAIAGSHGTRGRAVGRGAWSGAAIGGGLGVADSLLLRKGRNVVISSGQQLDLQLDAPISLSQGVQMGAF